MSNAKENLPTILAEATSMLAAVEAKDKKATLPKITDAYNQLAFAAEQDTVTKFKNKKLAVEALTELVASVNSGDTEGEDKPEVKQEESKPEAKAEEKKPAARRNKAIMCTIGDAEPFKLINSVPVSRFKDVESITVSKELNETGYFNTAWFTKRNIEVVVAPEEADE